MHRFLRSLFPRHSGEEKSIRNINRLRAEWAGFTDQRLREICHNTGDLDEVIAAAAIVSNRLLSLDMFDVQLHGALALAKGRIAEMQTGEGKTLAAVPAVVWYARKGNGVHVMTVNDYLARRDAKWMGGIYEALGFSVGCIQQGMSAAERKAGYACDITYSTANEIGFDFLRDQLALARRGSGSPAFRRGGDRRGGFHPDRRSAHSSGDRGRRIWRGSACACGRTASSAGFAAGLHFTIEEHFRNTALTDEGIRAIETAFGCGNLYAEENLSLLTAVQDSLHAHALLRRDVDYIVKDGTHRIGG